MARRGTVSRIFTCGTLTVIAVVNVPTAFSRCPLWYAMWWGKCIRRHLPLLLFVVWLKVLSVLICVVLSLWLWLLTIQYNANRCCLAEMEKLLHDGSFIFLIFYSLPFFAGLIILVCFSFYADAFFSRQNSTEIGDSWTPVKFCFIMCSEYWWSLLIIYWWAVFFLNI